ncbi:MAG: universal stress protein [Euryarchaeota archaeon]|nr:universal stress protein [Euryarchaeota archaeon]
MKKVLVAVDGSKPGEMAFQTAVQIADAMGATLEVVTVITGPENPRGRKEMMSLKEALEAQKRDAGELLQKHAAKARDWKLEVRSQVLEGEVPTELVNYARRTKADLLVVGNRGLSGVRRLLLGSVSRGVADRAKCNVLIVKENGWAHSD